ncbi:DegV family protein [Clostridia bacterium]|nr:DegV family protein [Clostridia bacterium]
MVRIIVDSATDMPEKLRKKHDILMVSLQVTVGDKSFRDWTELGPEELYDWLAREPIAPVTSQPVTSDWYEVLDGCEKRGEDVLIITMSSALSGTYSGAMLAIKNYPEMNIEVCDCRTASLGNALIALELVKKRDAGASLGELVEEFKQLNERIHTYVVVGSMEMLKRGGRISATSAMLGNILNIKPILLINEEGKLEPLEKVRGWKKAHDFLVQRYKEFAEPGAPVALASANNPDEVDRMAAGILGYDPKVDIHKMEIGAVIGSHVGPGTVGLALFERLDYE